MWKYVKSSLLALLASKKATMAVLGVAAWLAGKLGMDFTAAEALAMVSPVISFVVAQGVADHGKEAAKASGAKPG